MKLKINLVPIAIWILRRALRDPDYYRVWQASIAMFCYDAIWNARAQKYSDIHKACNVGATTFLTAFTRKQA